MAQTALDLITRSLRLINANAADEPLDVGQANDALQVLNDMIDSWNADRLSIYTTKSEDFALVSGQAVYTMGPGGDFNTVRPAQIDQMSSILLTNPEQPIEEPINMYSVQQWQTQIPVKAVQGSWPLVCYDTGDFPLRSLNFWPVPNSNINKVRIYSWQALTQPATLATTIAYPNGYARAFKYNLAVELSAEYQAPLRPEVVAIAAESKAIIKAMNAPDMTMRSDLLSSADGYNYKALEFGIPF